MNLEKFRKDRKLTQEEASRLLGMQKQTYQNYELKKRQPDIDTLCKLADFYNCSLDELVGRECDVVNLRFLSEHQSGLIRKILAMNEVEQLRTQAFIVGLMG